MQLAEKLGITDRAVSKWETGRSLPDASLMLDLCGLLRITVNELLSGEEVSMESYDKMMEKNLIEMVREKEKADRRLLRIEIVVGLTSTAFLFTMVGLAAWIMTLQDKAWIAILMIGGGFVQFIAAMAFALRIEQAAGYYECGKCGHRYVPSYGSVVKAMHMNRTRYMKCPVCGKRSWQKKVIGKE